LESGATLAHAQPRGEFDAHRQSDHKLRYATTDSGNPGHPAEFRIQSGKGRDASPRGKTWYVFPDAAHNQIYAGNSNQYQSFRLAYQDEQLTNGETGEANLAEDSAEWDAWDALGVWGGPY
jgi:hypothetical protein